MNLIWLLIVALFVCALFVFAFGPTFPRSLLCFARGAFVSCNIHNIDKKGVQWMVSNAESRSKIDSIAMYTRLSLSWSDADRQLEEYLHLCGAKFIGFKV